MYNLKKKDNLSMFPSNFLGTKAFQQKMSTLDLVKTLLGEISLNVFGVRVCFLWGFD